MSALLRRESGFRWPDTRCDAVVGRWTLGSGVLAHALNLAESHWLLARSGDLVGLTSTRIHATATPTRGRSAYTDPTVRLTKNSEFLQAFG